ncbi:MAG: right-handed parallel beta-helix repeat-containing protein [Planctomycetota bacterium]
MRVPLRLLGATAVIGVAMIAVPAGVVGPTECNALELVVDNVAGSDDAPPESSASPRRAPPLRTINRALELARPGDQITVVNTGEPYREQLSIGGCRLRGNSLRPLVIVSDGAVLDGTVAAAPGAWRHVVGDVYAMRPRRLAYQQVFYAGAPLGRVRLASRVGADQTLKPLEWSLLAGELLLRTEATRLPESYGFRHAGLQTGITLHSTTRVEIEGLVIQGFQQDGVNAHNLVTDCVLRNVECRANGRSGLSVGGASRVRVEASNFYDNGRVQVRSERLARLELQGCEVAGNEGAPASESRGGVVLSDGQPL